MPQVSRTIRRHPGRQRRAMTLVELLTVIFILVLLMASALPLARLALADRKITTATRQVTTFIEGIKARAAGSNRPMGVWVERDPLNPMGGYQLFAATVPQPYGGDVLNALAYLHDENRDGILDTAYFFRNECGFLDTYFQDGFLGGTIKPAYLRNVRFGDRIRLGSSSPEYMITSDILDVDQYRVKLHFRHPDAVVEQAPVSTPLDPLNPRVTYTPIHLKPHFQTSTSGVPQNNLPRDIKVRFQIVRAPRKALVKPLQLPAGIVIDLSNSGIGIPSSQAVWPFQDPNTGALLRPGQGQEFAPGLDRDTSYANDGISNLDVYKSVPTLNGAVIGDQRPVVIMFEPDGSIRSITCSRLGLNHRPTNNVHLLIGRREQLKAPSPYAPNGLRYSMNTNAPLAWFINQNLSDMANRWVSISPRSGGVTSAENGWAMNSDIRGGGFSFTGSLQACRQYAQDAQTSTMGR